MLEWIGDHSSFVSAATSLVTAGIWAAYLQLFYLAFRGQRRPVILINRAGGLGKDGHCLISNMSAAPVYVLSILAVMEEDGESWVCPVTDDEDLTEGRGTSERSHQGPLQSGGFMDLGPFDSFIQRVRALRKVATGTEHDKQGIYPAAIEIKVIALYASSRRFIGASRRFEAHKEEDAEWDLRPATLETEQLTGIRARMQMKHMLRDHL